MSTLRLGLHGCLGLMLGVAATACFEPDMTFMTGPFLDPTTGSPIDPTEVPADTSDTEGSTGNSGTGATSIMGSSSGAPDPDSSSGGSTGALVENTIYEIQDGTITAGSTVNVQEVVVTAVATDGFFAQEPPGGMYSGVFVFTGGGPGVARGDEVDISGVVTQMVNTTTIDVTAGTVEPTGMSGTELAPALISLIDLDALSGEPWEGVLVRMEGAPLAVTGFPVGAFTISDGMDLVQVGDVLFDATTAPMAFPSFGVNSTFSAVQGPVAQPNVFQVWPRDALDLEGYAPPITSETFNFPSAGDTSVIMFGTLPWNGGDYWEGNRATMIPSIDSVDVHIDVVSNGLTACGFQTAQVRINGVNLGTFTIMQGTTQIDQTFMAPMPIAGPVYTVRYETTMTVAPGCGAAGYSTTTSTITFNG